MSTTQAANEAETFTVTFHYDGFSVIIHDVEWDDPDAEAWVDDDVLIDKARKVLSKAERTSLRDYDSVEVKPA